MYLAVNKSVQIIEKKEQVREFALVVKEHRAFSRDWSGRSRGSGALVALAWRRGRGQTPDRTQPIQLLQVI